MLMPKLRHVLLAALSCVPVLPVSRSWADPPPETITITHSTTFPPLAFFSSDGKPKGMLVDLWKEFAKQQGVKVEFALSDWSSTLQLIEYKQADVHGGLFITDNRMEHMTFTRPLNITMSTRLFVSESSVDNPLSGFGNMVVGVVAGSYGEHYLHEHYPEIQTKPFRNNRILVESALAGKVTSFVTVYPVGMYYLHTIGDPEQFHAVETLYSKPLHAAVAKGNGALLGFVNQGLNKIPPEKFDQIISKWIYRENSTPRWLFPAVTTLILTLTGAFTLFYIITLKRQVRARRAELMLLNKIDTLTGIYNRKKMEEVFEEELGRFYRYQKPFSIILLDIDYFKDINDTYGHAVGDEVLTNLSLLLSVNIRRSDVVGRWGGEEFLLICPETEKAAASILAEGLRKSIETYGQSSSTFNSITSSFGVTQVNSGDDRKAIFARADEALYQAKNAGRNRVIEI